MQRVIDFSLLALRWDVFITHLPSRLRNLCRRRFRKFEISSRDYLMIKKKFTGMTNKADDHLNSQRQWRHTLELHKLKLDQVPSRKAQSGHWDRPLWKKKETIYKWKFLRGENQFSLLEWCWINLTPNRPLPRSRCPAQFRFPALQYLLILTFKWDKEHELWWVRR